MCVNKKKIFNRYANQWLYVNCGCCDACLQEKANLRATRIRNHAQSTGQIGVFVTLTYSNDFVPYIRKSEIEFGKDINVYRDYDVRRVNLKRTTCGFDTVLRKSANIDPIDTCSLAFHSENALKRYSLAPVSMRNLPSLRKADPDKVGIALYSDFQKFYKRLHINYERNYKRKLDTSFYACTEYGETYRRPHIHAVMFCKPEEFQQFRSCICSSWSYDDNVLDVQIARNCASYVASYVNCGSDFPRLLKEFFRPRCAYSRNFGLDSRAFTLEAILSKIKQGDLRYTCTRILDGILEPALLPIPYYVLHRYFPKCKGYSRLSPDETYRNLISDCFPLCERASELGISSAEIRQYATRLRNCYDRFRSFHLSRGSDATIFDYAIAHDAAWRAYYSTLIKQSHKDAGLFPYGNDYEFYYNIEDVYKGKIKSVLPPPPPDVDRLYSPNHFASVVRSTAALSKLYQKKKKMSKTTNLIMTQMGYEV